MKKRRFDNPREFLALLSRRKWWVAVPALALTAGIAVFALVLPSVYVSETLILIRRREVPQEFVRDLIPGTTDERLTAIEQSVLSRTNLLQILSQFESDLKEFKDLNDEAKVAKLRNQIKVSLQSERRGGLPLSYFRVSYQARDPELAQKITSRLASLFIEGDNRVREIQVFGTTEFLSSELQKLTEELRESDEKFRTLKENYRYELPDQIETNLRTLDRLRLQKQANGEALERHLSLRPVLERQISETPPSIAREASTERGALPETGGSAMMEEYRKKERAYEELRTRYKASYPDVRRAKADLERLKKEISPPASAQADRPAGSETPGSSLPNPVYQNLVAQLREVNTEIEIREREKKWIESETARYGEIVRNAPRREQDVSSASRGHNELMKQYEDLRRNLAQAKLAESLESRQRGSQFIIADAANFPLVPAKPNRLRIILIGFVLGLGFGAATAFVVDSLNPKIWTQEELQTRLGVSVLVEIPEIVTESSLSTARKRRLAHVFLLVVLSGVYVAGLYAAYTKRTILLKQLDPVVNLVLERS